MTPSSLRIVVHSDFMDPAGVIDALRDGRVVVFAMPCSIARNFWEVSVAMHLPDVACALAPIDVAGRRWLFAARAEAQMTSETSAAIRIAINGWQARRQDGF